METKIISLAEFRKGVSHIWKEAKSKKIKYVVMVHSKPVFEVTPVLDSSKVEKKIKAVKKAAKKKSSKKKSAKKTMAKSKKAPDKKASGKKPSAKK